MHNDRLGWSVRACLGGPAVASSCGSLSLAHHRCVRRLPSRLHLERRWPVKVESSWPSGVWAVGRRHFLLSRVKPAAPIPSCRLLGLLRVALVDEVEHSFAG